ncbi:MAG: sugar kinase, partial [Leifsonia sp.]|nr:sugar kinase [Leifsonia sp.]
MQLAGDRRTGVGRPVRRDPHPGARRRRARRSAGLTVAGDSAVPEVPYDLVTLGEAMAVLAPEAGDRLATAGTLTIGTAGAEANVARTVAQLGGRVAWVGALGADPLGDRILADLRASGVDVSHIIRDATAPTGLYLKDTDESRATAMYYYRKNSAASKMDAGLLSTLPRHTVLHLSGITAALSETCLELSRAALLGPRNGVVSFDVNHRPALWLGRDAAPVLAELANAADLVFVGLDEAAALWGTETIESIRELLPAPTTIVVKDGAIGATAHLADSEPLFEPAPLIDVLEPVGAGDAFAAGYLHALIQGRSERDRLVEGHAAAGRALMTTGDVAAADVGGAVVSGSDRLL